MTDILALFVAFSVGLSLPVLYLVAQWVKTTYQTVQAQTRVRNFFQLLHTAADVVKIIQTEFHAEAQQRRDERLIAACVQRFPDPTMMGAAAGR